MDAPLSATARPRLVVVYGHRALDAMQIAAGARGWCDLVWLIDAGDASAAQMRPLLRRAGPVVDALGLPADAAAEALRAHAPHGVATFYDTGMEHVAEIAAQLGLPFHSVQTARRLEDKLHQRDAFRRAGLPTPAVVALPEDVRDRAAVRRLAASMTFPAVLKPRRASGSWHTVRVDSASELGEVWAQLAREGPEAQIVEEYLPDGPPLPGGFEADYVSVETVVAAGEMTHLAVTGRFPLAPPFRETGFFIPATISGGQRGEVLELAAAALRAVGVEIGAAHTEIKLTADGPRVIEINGRVGGGVPDMLRLAAGIDIVELTMRASLALSLQVPGLPETSRVAYRFFYQPPLSARRLTSLAGLERLEVPGVERVNLHHPPGTALDARHGSRTYLFDVVGAAADHAALTAVEELLRTEIRAEYERA